MLGQIHLTRNTRIICHHFAYSHASMLQTNSCLYPWVWELTDREFMIQTLLWYPRVGCLNKWCLVIKNNQLLFCGRTIHTFAFFLQYYLINVRCKMKSFLFRNQIKRATFNILKINVFLHVAWFWQHEHAEEGSQSYKLGRSELKWWSTAKE